MIVSRRVLAPTLNLGALNLRLIMEYSEYDAELGGWVIWRCDNGDTIRQTEPESTEQAAWEAYWQLDGKQGCLYKGYVFH